MRFAAVFAVLCALFCFCGCAAKTDTAEKSAALRGGMTKAEVLKVMGDPLKNESFCKPDVWYYFVGQVWADGLVTEDECLPLVFENGKLVGWGMDFYARYRILAEKEKKTVPENKAGEKAGKKTAEKDGEKTDKK